MLGLHSPVPQSFHCLGPSPAALLGCGTSSCASVAVLGAISTVDSCSVVPCYDVVQTCSWIDECDVPGCAQSCILNRNSMNNAWRLQQRQYGEGSWQMCPELAFWVNLTRPGDFRSIPSRKLQEVSASTRSCHCSATLAHTYRCI